MKFNKQYFIENLKYVIEYNYEPEIELFDNQGRKYFIICYKDYIELYDYNDNYRKLKNVDELLFYIDLDSIIESSDDLICYGEPIQNHSILVEEKLWFSTDVDLNGKVKNVTKIRKRK